MAINPSQLGTAAAEDNNLATVEFLQTRPLPGEYLSTEVTPNKLFGYYDGFTDTVEIYIADATGRRYLRVS